MNNSRFRFERPVAAGLPVAQVRILPASAAASDTGPVKRLVSTRPNLAAHLDLVARFAALCRQNGVKLTVATTPLRGDRALLYDPADLRDVVERLSRIVPVWDFSPPNTIAWKLDYWDDFSHFKSVVGSLMLDRMFGPADAVPADFGTLRDATPAALSSRQ